MEWYLWLMIAALGLGLLAFTRILPKKNKNMFLGVAGVALVVSGIFWYGGGALPFAVTGDEAADTVQDTTAGTQLPISTLRVSTLEEYTSAKNAYNGAIRFYAADANLDDSLVADNQMLDTIQATTGSGSSTAGVLRTDEDYQFCTYNATDGAWYNECGTVRFSSNDYNTYTGVYSWDMGADGVLLMPMANLTDPLDESAPSTNINGQANVTDGTSEIQLTALGNDNPLIYDESNADGDYYVQFVIAASGGNKAIKEGVLCFQHESGAEPEGSEYTVITAEHVSGSEILRTSDLLSYWKNADCIDLGTIKGGQSETIKMTMTVNEAQLDTADDFKLIIDDLGGISARDYLSVKGTRQEAIDFDAQA